jgi:hypothetical protein
MFFRLLGQCFFVCVLMISTARAGVVLQIDLSTVNQVTISATTGLSAASVSGSDGNGVYLKDFLATASAGTFNVSPVAGSSFVYFNTTAGASGRLFRSGNTDPGLNLFNLHHFSSTQSFTAGVQAFKGTTTWDVAPDLYATFLAAPTSGDVYAFADRISQLNGGPQVIGQWGIVSSAAVPEPTSMAIFGLGALGLAYRARRKQMA